MIVAVITDNGNTSPDAFIYLSDMLELLETVEQPSDISLFLHQVTSRWVLIE